jgi:hypothetical protein
MARLEKRLLRFGFRAGAVPYPEALLGAFAGLSGGIYPRGFALVPPDAASWAGGQPADADERNEASLERCGVELVGPSSSANPDGPITAIAIAPDSPIEQLDLYVGGAKGEGSIHRIAPGAPFLGTISDNVMVRAVPTREFPVLKAIQLAMNDVTSSALARKECAYWELNDCDDDDGNHLQGIPARIEIYRGGAYPAAHQRRGRYDAQMIFEVSDRGVLDSGVANTIPSEPSLVMLVDGRRKFKVEAGLITGAGSLEVYAIGGMKTSIFAAPFGWSKFDYPVYTELLGATPITVIDYSTEAASAPTVFDYNGVPYYAIQARIVGGTIGSRGFINAHAWDE